MRTHRPDYFSGSYCATQRWTFTILFMFISGSLVQTAFAQNENSQLWASYSQGLIEQVLGGNGDGLQLLSPFETLDNGGPDQARIFHFNEWCNSVPASGVFYHRLPDNRVSAAYESYVSSLIPPKSENRQTVAKREAAQNKWRGTTKNLGAARRKAIKEWVAFDADQQKLPAVNRMGYNSWFDEHWGKVIGSMEANEERAALEYAGYLADGGAGQVADAITRLKSRQFQLESFDPTTGISIKVPGCSLSPDVSSVRTPGLSEVRFSSTSVDGKHEIERWSAGGGASLFGFIRVAGGGVGTKESRWEKKYSYTVSFGNLRAVEMSRPWLVGNLVEAFHDESYFQKRSAQLPYIVSPQQLWSRNGSWPLTPSRLIVGYKPSITVVFSEDSWKEAQTSFGGSLGFSLGPFQVEGGGGNSKYEKSWSERDRSLTLSSKTEDIYIVGVVSQDNSRYLRP